MSIFQQRSLFGVGTLAKVSEFDGPAYESKFDHERLSGQLLDVYECMRDGLFRTLHEIHLATGHPHASISAQLRHLRKKKFGGHVVEKRPRGDRANGLWEYRLMVG